MPVTDIQTTGPAVRPPLIERTFSAPEAAAILNMKLGTLYKYVQRGRIRPMAVPKKPYYFSESELSRLQKTLQSVDVFS